MNPRIWINSRILSPGLWWPLADALAQIERDIAEAVASIVRAE